MPTEQNTVKSKHQYDTKYLESPLQHPILYYAQLYETHIQNMYRVLDYLTLGCFPGTRDRKNENVKHMGHTVYL